MSAPAEAAPYERLARMIEHELELLAGGRLDEFEAAVQERGERLERLPPQAPESALVAVERSRALHARVIIEAERVREALASSRATLNRAQRVTRGYAGPARRRYTTSA